MKQPIKKPIKEPIGEEIAFWAGVAFKVALCWSMLGGLVFMMYLTAIGKF